MRGCHDSSKPAIIGFAEARGEFEAGEKRRSETDRASLKPNERRSLP
jgi:hypothetical protein